MGISIMQQQSQACRLGEGGGGGGRGWCTSIQWVMLSGEEPVGSCRLMMAATTMSSGLHTRGATSQGQQPYSSQRVCFGNLVRQQSAGKHCASRGTGGHAPHQWL